jgi:N-acetyltransferase 10
LGNTYGMCVLQDFEAITPNTLARTIETVEGGGMVVLLLKSMNSLKQLYTMTMVKNWMNISKIALLKKS